jgi:acyl transferase domain-containing protein
MSARRTIAHPQGGWSAIAVHLEPAESTQEGFYLTLFPDGRSPQVVFLRPPQLAQLVEMAAQSNVSDQQLWEAVAKIPLEPLLPNRSLSSRLRALLVDQATPLRDQIKLQSERKPPVQVPVEEEPAAPEAVRPPEDDPWKPLP